MMKNANWVVRNASGWQLSAGIWCQTQIWSQKSAGISQIWSQCQTQIWSQTSGRIYCQTQTLFSSICATPPSVLIRAFNSRPTARKPPGLLLQDMTMSCRQHSDTLNNHSEYLWQWLRVSQRKNSAFVLFSVVEHMAKRHRHTNHGFKGG